jgi:hypothetical protein
MTAHKDGPVWVHRTASVEGILDGIPAEVSGSPRDRKPDRDQIEMFVDGLFRHASTQGFVSLRAFYEDDAAKPFRISATALSGGLRFLVDVAEDDASRAANYPCSAHRLQCSPTRITRGNAISRKDWRCRSNATSTRTRPGQSLRRYWVRLP